MSIRLSLVCHAAPPVPRAVGFYEDEAVDPAQLASASAMALGLGRVERIWCGPERRTWQTAEALSPGAIVKPALRDCDFGRWRGHALAEIEARDPDGVAAWLADMGSAPHGGESLLDVIGRVGHLVDGHRDPGHTVAVTHPAVIRAAIVHSLGAPPRAFWRIDVEPLSVTDLRQSNGRWTLRSVGRMR
jgi:broad specificity phosphatase PhoE